MWFLQVCLILLPLETLFHLCKVDALRVSRGHDFQSKTNPKEEQRKLYEV